MIFKPRTLIAAILLVLVLLGLFLFWRMGPGARSSQPPLKGQLTRIEARPEAGFHWPYYLYIPKTAQDRGAGGQRIYLLLFPNNTGQPSDDLAVHDQAARGKVSQVQDIANQLGTPLLIPVFPRPWEVPGQRDLYIHALDRRTLETNQLALARVDLQLMAMLDDAAARLGQRGWQVSPRALMMGFSASGMFANRFTVLHPERILAASVGSPGGWPIAPLDEWQGSPLNYPLGVADLQSLTGAPFDIETYRAVPQFLFIGDQDDNDAVDSENRPLLAGLFGDTPVKRWPHAEELYRAAGANAHFRLEPGTGHTISDPTWRDQIAFFKEAIAADED